MTSDLQDRQVDEAGIRWSNQYGDIGTGQLVQTDTLQVGENLVAVTVTNSSGLSSTATVTVVVGDQLAPLGPRFSLAPGNIAWHVEDEDMAFLTEGIEVLNGGGGDLVFDVASDADWLAIDGAFELTELVAPATLSVGVDAALLPSGTTRQGRLTFQSRIDPEDVVVVQVDVAKGDVFNFTGEVDPDGDGVPNLVDNCPETANADQADADGDGVGDSCEERRARFVRGDCNDDLDVDISDAAFTLGFLFLGQADPGCDDACDSNDDGAVDISDAIATLRVLFLGNGIIPPPGMTECGVDPTEDEWDCMAFSRCP